MIACRILQRYLKSIGCNYGGVGYAVLLQRSVPMFASAADDIGAPWDGTTRTQPAQASDGYYLISNGPELAWFCYQVVNNNNRNINGRLTANINLNNKVWTPIGYHDRQYGGTFDGQGFTVTGVYVTTTSNDRGFFGKVTTSAVIKNLNVNDVTVTGNRNYTAGLVGVAVGAQSATATSRASALQAVECIPAALSVRSRAQRYVQTAR